VDAISCSERDVIVHEGRLNEGTETLLLRFDPSVELKVNSTASPSYDFKAFGYTVEPEGRQRPRFGAWTEDCHPTRID
jgi:hypothetical protein